MEPRWRELPLLKPDREDRSALLSEYSTHTDRERENQSKPVQASSNQL
jgi:hypothetical protein